MNGTSALFLKTLGSSALVGTLPSGSVPLRAKDLALLVYLCVTGPGKYTRSALATLLWGDRDEARARHSLTQALRRVRLAVGTDALTLGERVIEWRGQLACDALELGQAVSDCASAELGLPSYGGDFVADLDVGPGASGFSSWADERRAHFRFAAARVLDAQGSAAESLGSWNAAMQLGLRLIEIEPMSQQAHRRVMRAWSALGEQALAVRHYRQFERWLREEWGEAPDPSTRALFQQLHSDGIPSDLMSPVPVREGLAVPAIQQRPSPAPAIQITSDGVRSLALSATPAAVAQPARARSGFVFVVTIAVLMAIAIAVVIATLEP